MTIIANATIVIANLYWERIIKKGKTLKKFAKLAPAPNKINSAGRAQHIRVDEDAKRLKKFAVLSFIFETSSDQLLRSQYLNVGDGLSV